MRKKKNQLINIPLEFKVACSLYKIDVAEVLQIFIDHVTVYDFMNPDYHQGFTEASHSLIFCIKKKGQTRIRSSAMKKCKELFFRSIHQIEILVRLKKRGWKTATKRNYTRYFVENIFNAMERLHAPSDILYLDEYTTLKLSKDFCVLCELYDCYPKEFLEYFMGYISVADAHACDRIKGYTNFIYSFFFLIANGFGRSSNIRIELLDWELDFYERMEELRLEVYIIRDLQKRADTLRDFYVIHYQTMNPN
ncbi:hypothetical protein [Pedobacter sp. L105]|uniref:hypothetical protein n=1 Tax=Pedobacter sp. L105 TaxID=1641871 RepID=UPI00131CA35D|nr:hypothetical protein [Pedobacter sp. L105]